MCVNKFGKTKFGVNWLKIFLTIRIHKYKRFQSRSKGSIVQSLLMAAVQVTIITCTLASVSFFIFLDTLNNRVFQLYMHTQFCCNAKTSGRFVCRFCFWSIFQTIFKSKSKSNGWINWFQEFYAKPVNPRISSFFLLTLSINLRQSQIKTYQYFRSHGWKLKFEFGKVFFDSE